MIKTLNIPLDFSDYEKIIEIKGKTTWRDFLLNCCANKDKKSEKYGAKR